MTLNNDDEKIVKLRKKVCDVESYAQDVVTKLSRWLLSKEEKLLTLKTTWLGFLLCSAVSDKNTKNGKK